MLNRMWLWLRSFVLRGRLEREMREEMAEHLDRATERLVERGLSEEAARRQAAREFGNVVWLQEEARHARGTMWLDALVADMRFAVRHSLRRPAVTMTMFVVLVAGMTLSTLLFAYVHSYAESPPAGMRVEEDLVRIRGSQSAGVHGRGVRTFTEEEFGEYRELGGAFASVAGWTDAMVLLDADAGRRGIGARVTFVTENYFPVLGVRTVHGTELPRDVASDPALASTAVLGYSTWEVLFGADPDVIGTTLRVNEVPVTIVGVAPPRFMGATGTSQYQVWLPLEARRLVLPDAPAEYRAAGRLRAGVSAREASAAAEVVAARMAEGDPALEDLAVSTEVVPLLSASGDPMYERDVRLMSVVIGLLALLILLITCTNVSGLQMGLATARRQEVAVRLSLGAPRGRIIRQLLTESALLATAAGALAVAMVSLVLRAATRLIPGLPVEIGITWPATVFTFGVALAAGVGFGLSPALHATRLGVASAMRDSAGTIAGTRSRLQRGLVVAQIAFTQPMIVLLAAVLVLVLGEFRPLSPTALAERVAALTVSPAALITGSDAAAAEARAQARAALPRVLERVRSTAGVEAAVMRWTSVDVLGAWRAHPADRVRADDRDPVALTAQTVDPGHFELLGIPVVRGRTFAPVAASPGTSRSETPVIIDTDLARRLWAGSDAVGRRLEPAADTMGEGRTFVVVGVVEDPLAAERRPGDPHRIYVAPQDPQGSTTLFVRTTGPAEPRLSALREAAREAAPGLIIGTRTLATIEDEQRRTFRLVTSALTAAGAIALLLSAIGLYAVIAFSVNQRSGEIAVRMAFGARARQIVQRFVGDGLRLSAIGLAFGLPVSLLGLRLLATVPGIPHVPLPPVTVIAALGVLLVAGAAAWIPARRAASVDPSATLRRE